MRALLLPAEEYSEGVSFSGVRRVIFPDLSPDAKDPSWAILKQRIARAVRLCSHKIYDGTQWVLGAEEQTVSVELYVSAMPASRAELLADVPELAHHPGVDAVLLAGTVDEAKLKHVEEDREIFEGHMAAIERCSIEYGLGGEPA